MPRKNSQIRIISGKLGGRLIDTPKTDKTHPMGDRERSAIFNRLRGEIADKIILDAFAGSGAIGLEALSLGAAEVDFLENNRKATTTIHNNIAKFKLESQGKIVRKLRDEYDIIFADPPYENPQYEYIEEILKHLKHGGIFVLSHPESPAPWEFRGLSLFSDKSYAAAHVKMYQKL
ncbi:RsmD family RNA methyltransferase [Candidatus Saccharibacteria bacterium]|nr:RsmD family RNA methyltransferase [Candidatus Saccharibacteria bacterium]MBR3378263.1 RsmD family RNA methyltransferase [Candidatus Saccharibacteria bacterium]